MARQSRINQYRGYQVNKTIKLRPTRNSTTIPRISHTSHRTLALILSKSGAPKMCDSISNLV